MTLESLGWNDEFAEAFAPYEEQGLVPARVAVQHRGGYVVLTEDGELEAEAARRQVRSGELAGVGDWVALRLLPEGQAIVEAVLPRRTAFTRKETMDRTGEQIVAANVDTVFLVSALGHDLNLRRLERYLTAAWDSGAEPVIVLTKADLHLGAVPETVADVEAIAFGVPVHAVSNVTGEGLDALDRYLGPGRTVALLGSSGVGKSTLVNSLLGEERMATAEVREDDERGRHTTTHRELVPLPGGALLLDTPGMRELQLYADEEALDTAFADIAELAARVPLLRLHPRPRAGLRRLKRRSRTAGSHPSGGRATGSCRPRSARSRSARTSASVRRSGRSGGSSPGACAKRSTRLPIVNDHLVGLLLGTEEDWPRAFEALVGLMGEFEHGGERHRLTTERVTIEPFDLRMKPRHALVIDRLAYWYYVPREWLKKVALMDGVYLLNNPFTFQSMEKHSAYCAMMRLGLKVPETWLLPHKEPPDNPRFPYMAAKYNLPFELEEVAGHVGYPLYMKPFDGGQWVGVTRIGSPDELHRRYDESGERLMHLQAAVEDFDVFARSLSIGAETMTMRFEPDRPMHDRYHVDHAFLSPESGEEIVTISRLVNAFFGWEFNSCETIVKDGVVSPIDYANASPDVSLISLHYYFPWAITALAKWSAFCVATGPGDARRRWT